AIGLHPLLPGVLTLRSKTLLSEASPIKHSVQISSIFRSHHGYALKPVQRRGGAATRLVSGRVRVLPASLVGRHSMDQPYHDGTRLPGGTGRAGATSAAEASVPTPRRLATADARSGRCWHRTRPGDAN